MDALEVAASIFRDAWHRADDEGQVGGRVDAGIRALAAAGLLVSSPRTITAEQREAAEVEWAVRDTHNFVAEVAGETEAREMREKFPDFWTPIYRTPAGPWIEAVSR